MGNSFQQAEIEKLAEEYTCIKNESDKSKAAILIHSYLEKHSLLGKYKGVTEKTVVGEQA